MFERKEDMNEEFEELELVPTVLVGIEGGSFFAEVIEMYELPFEKVIKALSTANGPAQMMAMLEIFKLAIVDQSRVDELEVLSFNETAEILGQWAVLSTPPTVKEFNSGGSGRRVKRIKLTELESSEDVHSLINKIMDPETSIEELLELAEGLKEDDSEEPPTRGRHAKPYRSNLDEPLNDPGDDISPF
jgi:membrane-associated protease RseP (regulator of RpoE activity)